MPGHVSARSMSKAAGLPGGRCGNVAPSCRPESASAGLAGKRGEIWSLNIFWFF